MILMGLQEFMNIKHAKFFIPDSAPVDVRVMNEICELRYLQHRNTSANIKKISKDRYLDKATGIIKFFKHSDFRSDNVNSLRQTFAKLRNLINNNFCGGENELFITLTYQENQDNLEIVSKDFDRFIKKLRRYFEKSNKKTEYIAVREPQERGAWHIHLLLKSFDGELYIQKSELAKLWGHGFVNVKRLDGITNIGAYLTAYLCDIPVFEDEFEDADRMYDLIDRPGVLGVKNTESDSEKKVVKGARLCLYPVGANLYTKSSGIKYPDIQRVNYGEIQTFGFLPEQLSSRKALEIYDDTRNFKNTIVVEQYNKNHSDKSTNNVVYTKKWCEDTLRDENRGEMLKDIARYRLNMVMGKNNK